MLMITRKENDAIVIDLGEELIEVMVTEIGKQVRLGITAPDKFKIWRKELYTTVLENKQAVGGSEPQNLRGVLQKMGSRDDTPKTGA